MDIPIDPEKEKSRESIKILGVIIITLLVGGAIYYLMDFNNVQNPPIAERKTAPVSLNKTFTDEDKITTNIVNDNSQSGAKTFPILAKNGNSARPSLLSMKATKCV